MNVFLSQDFLTVIHDMKFPGYQKSPFLQESPGFFTGMPLRTIISVITPSLSASRLQGEVLLLIFGGIIPSWILRIRRVPSILADTQVISGKFFRTAAATSEQLIFFFGHPMVYILLIQKSRISPVLFLTFPQLWIFQILPVKKISGYLPESCLVKKPFFFIP